jgi:hypothetical protein
MWTVIFRKVSIQAQRLGLIPNSLRLHGRKWQDGLVSVS